MGRLHLCGGQIKNVMTQRFFQLRDSGYGLACGVFSARDISRQAAPFLTADFRRLSCLRCTACSNCRNFLGFRLTNYVQTLIDQINAFKKDGSIKKPDRSFLANAPIELKLLSVQFEKLVRQVQSTQKKLEESNLDLTHQVNLRTEHSIREIKSSGPPVSLGAASG